MGVRSSYHAANQQNFQTIQRDLFTAGLCHLSIRSYWIFNEIWRVLSYFDLRLLMKGKHAITLRVSKEFWGRDENE